MKGKFLVGLAVLVLVVIGVFAFGFSSPPEDAVRAGITGNVVAGETGFSGAKVSINK